MKFELDRDERKRLIQTVQRFFSEQREEDIGVIAADRVVDFFIDTLGSALYNAALDNARAWFAQALVNLEVDYDQLYRK